MALERPQINMTVVVHDQTCALDKDALTVGMQALEMCLNTFFGFVI